jgi:hypothetical protein
VKQRLPVMAARGTLTIVWGVVGLYGKLIPACILIHRTCSWGPLVRRACLASVLLVGDSDTCKAEPWSGTSVGAMVRTQSSSPWSGTEAMLLLTGRPVGITGLGGLDEVAAHEGGCSFQVLSWASRNVSGRRVRWGPWVLGPFRGPRAAL